ncbi:unnamed protein product [Caenorhabditis angaria]|uniref:FBA domain-containing protein n=1 Tax=Caenorhabditis angaria TaxID=860376 RepID=A0A9P1J357_9PELO|nr:unnamed protein product [Caenorhabditis angaria]
MPTVYEAYQIEHGKTQDYHEKKYNIRFLNYGHGVNIEKNGVGVEVDPNIPACFAFSYEECSVESVIELKTLGIDDSMMNHNPPKIEITQIVNHRIDCSSSVRLVAQLSDNPRFYETSKITEFSDTNGMAQKSWTKGQRPCAWEKLTITLHNYYAPGTRWLKVFVAGKGNEERKDGHFGPKIGKLLVKVTKEGETEPIIGQSMPRIPESNSDIIDNNSNN